MHACFLGYKIRNLEWQRNAWTESNDWNPRIFCFFSFRRSWLPEGQGSDIGPYQRTMTAANCKWDSIFKKSKHSSNYSSFWDVKPAVHWSSLIIHILRFWSYPLEVWLRFPNLYIDTSAYVPSRYPKARVEYMRGRGAKRVTEFQILWSINIVCWKITHV